MARTKTLAKNCIRCPTLDTVPFYGICQTDDYLLCSMDGVRINETMYAIRDDISQIDDLYVCSDMSGSFFNGSYAAAMASRG